MTSAKEKERASAQKAEKEASTPLTNASTKPAGTLAGSTLPSATLRGCTYAGPSAGASWSIGGACASIGSVSGASTTLARELLQQEIMQSTGRVLARVLQSSQGGLSPRTEPEPHDPQSGPASLSDRWTLFVDGPLVEIRRRIKPVPPVCHYYFLTISSFT